MKVFILIILSILLNPTEPTKDSNIGMLQGHLYGTSKDGKIKIHLKYIESEIESQFQIEEKNKTTSFKSIILNTENQILYRRKRFDSLEFKSNNHYYKIVPNKNNFTKIECFSIDGLGMGSCVGYYFNGIMYSKKNENDKGTMINMNFKIEEGI